MYQMSKKFNCIPNPTFKLTNGKNFPTILILNFKNVKSPLSQYGKRTLNKIEITSKWISKCERASIWGAEYISYEILNQRQ